MAEPIEAVLDEIEKAHPDGIPSQEIVEVLERLGVKFSEAGLRKYVQLGLLPRSVRVGRSGKHKGSLGLYPATIVRQVVEIKRLLQENYTIDQIRQEHMMLRSEIEGLERTLDELFGHIQEAIDTRGGDTVAEHVKREMKSAKAVAEDLVGRLTALETRLSLRSKLAKAAG